MLMFVARERGGGCKAYRANLSQVTSKSLIVKVAQSDKLNLWSTSNPSKFLGVGRSNMFDGSEWVTGRVELSNVRVLGKSGRYKERRASEVDLTSKQLKPTSQVIRGKCSFGHALGPIGRTRLWHSPVAIAT